MTRKSSAGLAPLALTNTLGFRVPACPSAMCDMIQSSAVQSSPVQSKPGAIIWHSPSLSW